MKQIHPLLLSTLAAALVACMPADARTAPLSEAAEWLQSYLQIDTTNPPGNEGESAQFLADILLREGIVTERLISPGGRTSLYARLEADRPSDGSDPGALLLLHHMDVVPATEDWKHPPFSGTIDDGKLWGRGAIDTKGLGIAHLAAFIDLHRRAVPLERDVIFLAVADEERGGAEGTQWILERHADLLGEVHVVLNEGGNNPQGSDGRTLWAGIEVAQKRPLWLEVTTKGRGGHASGYRPTSASHRLIQALDNLLELEIPFRTTAPLELYLRALAPMQNEQRREVFLNFSDYLEPSGPTVQLAPWIYPLLLDTVQVTVLSASDSINSTARNASALVDVRLLPDTDADRFLERVREAMGERVDIKVLLVAPPSEPSPVDHPAFRAIAGVLGEGRPVIPTFLAGITDSRFFRERSIPAYGVFPFFLAAPDLMGIHGRDERIPLAEFDEGIVRMVRIVEAIAGASDPN